MDAVLMYNALAAVTELQKEKDILFIFQAVTNKSFSHEHSCCKIFAGFFSSGLNL